MGSALAVPIKRKLSRNWSTLWKYIRPGPSHFFMYTLGRFMPVRAAVVWAYSLRSRRAEIALAASLLEKVDVDLAVRSLSEHGIFAGLRLQSEVLEELQRFSAASTCFGEEDAKFPFCLANRTEAERRYGRKLMVGRFDDVLQTCSEVQVLASDPTLLAIARGYLGIEPVLLGSRMWWSFAAGADAAQQVNMGQGFHYDIDGYRALAFFFYLSDVTSSTGPHISVRGSHVEKPLKSLLSLYKSRTDSEIEKWYGPERQITLCGSAGSGFAEDIFCFHKGTHPRSSDRLILQIRYGIHNYGAKED